MQTKAQLLFLPEQNLHIFLWYFSEIGIVKIYRFAVIAPTGDMVKRPAKFQP
jgi:hypothetical protein